MPLSMTGYGRGQASSQELSVTVELRGINSRYCEVSLRLPPGFQSLDAELRRRVSDAVVRGKVDLTLSRAPAPGLPFLLPQQHRARPAA